MSEIVSDLSKQEKELLERVLQEHRLILAKSGYGKIFIDYQKAHIEVMVQNQNRTIFKKLIS